MANPQNENLEARVVQLVQEASAKIQDRSFSEAANILRDASNIAPDHAAVKSMWLALREEEGKSPAVELCQKWVLSKDEKDGDEFLEFLRKNQITQDVAEECMKLIMVFKEEDDTADNVTGVLLQQIGAKKYLAAQLNSEPTLTFEQIFLRGDDSMDGMASAILDSKAWSSEDIRIKAERNVFMLSLAQMMEAGLDHPERAMKCISRLLGAESIHLNGIIDADSFDVILNSLDIRMPMILRSQATLATSKLVELSPEPAQALISNYVTTRVSKPTTDGLIMAFSAAAAIFPISPEAATSLFLTDGFIPGFVSLINTRKSSRLEQASLELLSAACIDKGCREAIGKHCKDWLQGIVDTSSDQKKSSLAALVLMKLAGDKNPVQGGKPTKQEQQDHDELVAKFKTMVLSQDKSGRQDAIEGLAYGSMQPRIKEELADDPILLKKLIDMMKDPQAGKPFLFGSLAVFVNLTTYLPVLSEEQKKMSELKAYANTSKPVEPDPLDDDEHVSRRCSAVLKAGIVPLLITSAKAASPSVLYQVLKILLALSKEQKHRGIMAQQGAVKLLLQIWDTINKETHPHPISYDSNCKHAAAHALARILISVNPAHIFSASTALPVTSATRALLTLLHDDHTQVGPRNFLPAFEALLGLTNLASMDESARDAIIRLDWPKIEELMLHSNTHVQRATVELVCNLMQSPTGVEKFADGTRRAGNRLHILLALADVDEIKTRSAAGGALAMLTEWSTVTEAVLSRERGVEIILGLCKENNEELRHRGVAVVMNLLGQEGQLAARAKESLKQQGAVEVLRAVGQKSRNPQVLQIAVGCLQLLVQG